jgi:hypothetical protein
MDAFEHIVGSRQHIVVPEAQHTQSASFQCSSPRFVARGVVKVLASVQLDDQPQFRAIEVDEVTRDRVLSAELETAEPATSQVLPKSMFRICSLRAQLARPMCRIDD